MKLAIISDAWAPQVNGVTTTIHNTVRILRQSGHDVLLLTPDQFQTLPCPGQNDIRLAVSPYGRAAELLDGYQPDAIHIATEGTIGWAARKYCLRNDLPFATSYHTCFPEFIPSRTAVSLELGYRFLRRYHAPARCTMVRTRTQRDELAARGFQNLRIWPGAVDTELFRPQGKSALGFPRPISMYMGWVTREEGLESFLDLDLPGTQVVIGDGPDREELQNRYPAVQFLGTRHGVELAAMISAADVFVVPGCSDTFGLTMLEAMACGVPVAALPVPGPRDVIIQGSTGIMDEDLARAIFRALQLDGDACVDFALAHNWRRSTERFLRFQTHIARSQTAEEEGAQLITSVS